MPRVHWPRGVAAIALTLLPFAAQAHGQTAPPAADLSARLERQTQELMDAVAIGDKTPWQRYLADDLVYAAEDGAVKTKAQLLDELQPLPGEVWGKLRVTRFRAVLHGATAIANYVAEEDEGYFGQTIHARYLCTDTWIETPAGWKLAASQLLALRDDPPAITLPPGRLDEYVGVYSLTPDVTYTIKRDGDALVGQRSGRKPETLRVEVADCLFVPGQPRLRKIFQRDANGRIAGFVERRESWDIAWRRLP